MRQAISLYIIGDGLSRTDLIEIVLSRYFVSVSLYPKRDSEKRKARLSTVLLFRRSDVVPAG